MIAEDQAQEIIAAARIEDVIAEFVTLKKQGKNLVGLCPFHTEKTPSFNVNPGKGIYKCFGCGKAGDAASFLMEYQKMSFPEALKYLAKRYNISIQEKERSEEEDKAWKEREGIYQVNEFAVRHYAENLKLPKNKAALDYAMSRFTEDEIIQFQIGYASDKDNDLLLEAKKQGFIDDILIRSTLIRESEKTHVLYDYFRGRIMFPIYTAAGRVAGFGGRTILKGPQDENGTKYINTPDTPVYHKSTVLYGLNFARQAISKTDCCYVVEGYADVIRMHQLGIDNTVAPCGTALTPEQIQMIRKLTINIVMLFDGDDAGLKASIRNGEISLEAGMNVMVVRPPDGQDPDDFFKEENINYLTEKKQHFILWRSDLLMMKTGDDPLAKHYATGEICRLIAIIGEASLRSFYIEDIVKRHKIQKKILQDKLDELKPGEQDNDDEHYDLPSEVNPRDFERWGFYEYNNEYFFRTKESIQKFSNFIMKPLFHVESINNTRRIFELTNYKGFKVVIDFDMNEMTSLANFKRNIEGRGNFLWWGSDSHMNRLKLKLYEDTRTCYEVRNLGWQGEGFWAWSNGIIANGRFQPIDDNGLVEYNHKYYFIPAFSKIYIDDKSIFIDERKFAFQKCEITLEQWTGKFVEVFGDNAILGIAFWLAALFRDYILHIFKNFPILNLFGPKGTGKSQMAMSLSCLFGRQQTPFNIHNGTKAGLAEHLQQFVNAIAWVDEYKNSIEYDKIETLKSIYDSIGRNRLNLDKGMKKETTLVNQAVILSGQEMPTADVALFSRVIFLQFHKTEFTIDEKRYYDELKAMENDGLSHLTSDVLMHRDYFEKNYYRIYEEVLADIFACLEHSNIEDRIMRSMCSILAAFKTLEPWLNFPFIFEKLKEIAIKSIGDQNRQISKSNEVAIFWEILEALFDENILTDRWNFKIDHCKEINTKEGKKDLEGNIEVLKLKFSSIYKLYAEHSRKIGQTVLPNSTLKYYLENSNYYLGLEYSTRFYLKERDKGTGEIKEETQITSAYCFNYEKLRKDIGINLTRLPSYSMESLLYIKNYEPDPDEFLIPKEEKLPF